ncbi:MULTISPECIES: hypothetical protein [unclassified Pseudomonas]|uniref:hypothetical protein n=1 Tax=unclassified Pseudomonas TaxID=196821 RepID=UPI00214BF03E|nr:MULTISPECIES: hypothetical protein [unclassified Pseudomonas]MEC4240024.1 hypothetical protein [Pseudomonas sp. DSV-1]
MRSMIGYLVCLIVAATRAFTFSPRPASTVASAQLRPDRLQINGMRCCPISLALPSRFNLDRPLVRVKTQAMDAPAGHYPFKQILAARDS